MAVLSGDGAEAAAARIERLRQSEPVRGLSRALRVAEGFGLYILVCERPSDATVMLDLVREKLQQQGENVQWVHLFATTHTGDLMDNLERDLLAPLVRERSAPPAAGEAVALHAEEIRPADRRTWIGLFNRMNRARNLVTQRLGVPLVLLITPDNEALFAEGAPDFWSLRSDVWRAEHAEPVTITGRSTSLVDFVRFVQEAAARVCRVELAGVPQATGFLIGPDLVLTVSHGVWDVLERPAHAADLRFRFDAFADPTHPTPPEGTLFPSADDWLLDNSPPSLHEQSSDEGVPALDELDYAILRVRGAPGEWPTLGGNLRGWFPLRRDVAPAVGDPMTLLHYPFGGPLQIAGMGPSVVGYNANRTRLKHRVDTSAGSAGAPCFDRAWNVVAMHHASMARSGYNQAIPIAAIYDLLRARGKLDEIERHARVAPLQRPT